MGDRILYEFEFHLRPELIKQLVAIEPFSEKWDFKNSENRITNSGDGAKLESFNYMHHSIVIEKTSNEESKLIVKVYDIPNERTKVQDVQSQTDELSKSNKNVMVKPRVSHCTTQTQKLPFSDSEIQTTESRLHSTDRETESEFNMATQTDKDVMAVSEQKDSECQASVTTMERECQNVISLVSVELQVEQSISYASVQTDIKEFCDTLSQTQSSIACETEVSVQVSCEVKEQDSQVELILTEIHSQTDMSMSTQKEIEVQATTDLGCSGSQTEIPTSEMETETDFNMATQCHGESQICVETVDASFQMGGLGMDSECLTDHNLSTQESRDIQTEEQTQTEDLTLNETSGFLNADDSVLDVSQNQSNVSHITNVERFVDRVSQTDPVTIIIGDASFLVQKLKSSAMNASKVTTSGNEIEIELSADMVEQADQEKTCRSNPARIVPVEIKPASTPEVVRQPVQRVGTAHRGGGVRMRMPVSASFTPNQNKMPHANLQARTPNTTPVITPQIQRTSQASQLNKSSPGLFSCPFCNLCFIESPALYEHLSAAHQSDLKSKWKKSQGREGKTIIPRSAQNTPQSNKKPNPDAGKASAEKSRLISPREAGTGGNSTDSWRAVKRKKTYANISRKYRRVEDEEEDDDEEYDDDDYEEEEYSRPVRGGRS